MWTVAGCGFCLHFVPGSDSPFLWHGDVADCPADRAALAGVQRHDAGGGHVGALLSPCVRAKKKQETVQRFPALWCFQWEAGIQLFFSYDLRFHKL